MPDIDAIQAKMMKIDKYMAYSKELGTLTDTEQGND